MVIRNDNHREKGIRRDAKIGGKPVKKERYEKVVAIKNALPIFMVFGIGTSIYCFRMGRKSGYLDGVNAGYVKGGQELIASWREHSEQLRLCRET